MRAPNYLYMARLGFLMGRRFLMIDHRGRRSGDLHHTVVEVAGRHPDRDEWVVASGWGPGADWYRNLQAGGLEGVWIGSRRHAARMRFLDPVEAAGVMGAYESAHPLAARVIYRELGLTSDGTEEERVGMMRQIPMVAFTIEP